LLLPETRRSSRLAQQWLKSYSGIDRSDETSGLSRRGIHDDRIPLTAPPPPPPPPAPPLPTFHSGMARAVLPLKEQNVNVMDKVRLVLVCVANKVLTLWIRLGWL